MSLDDLAFEINPDLLRMLKSGEVKTLGDWLRHIGEEKAAQAADRLACERKKVEK